MKSLIALIGMMGAGKSTAGLLLSQRLGYGFFDIDKEIENDENTAVSNIFNEHGENYFRKLEKRKILSLLASENAVLALGGGAFEDEEIQKALNDRASVIYLKASPGCLFERIKSEIHRPLLHKDFSVETITFILKKRLQNYEKARYTVDTTGKTPENVVSEIIGVLK